MNVSLISAITTQYQDHQTHLSDSSIYKPWSISTTWNSFFFFGCLRTSTFPGWGSPELRKKVLERIRNHSSWSSLDIPCKKPLLNIWLANASTVVCMARAGEAPMALRSSSAVNCTPSTHSATIILLDAISVYTLGIYTWSLSEASFWRFSHAFTEFLRLQKHHLYSGQFWSITLHNFSLPCFALKIGFHANVFLNITRYPYHWQVKHALIQP